MTVEFPQRWARAFGERYGHTVSLAFKVTCKWVTKMTGTDRVLRAAGALSNDFTDQHGSSRGKLF